MSVVERIVEHAARLTPTERRIAEVLSTAPQTVAFGTVAQVAERAGSSGPSVVRLAVKLGYSGFVGLQAAVQAELASQLSPVHARTNDEAPLDLLGRVERRELDNVAATLSAISADAVDHAVARLADPARRVWVLGGEVTTPVAAVLAGQLASLRDGVTLLGGSPAALGKAVASMADGDVLVAVDVRRYERSVADAVALAGRGGVEVVAITDGPLSPLAAPPALPFFVDATGAGPFDSMTAAVAVANLLAAGVAAALGEASLRRREAVEEAWGELDAIVGAATAATAKVVDLTTGAERVAL